MKYDHKIDIADTNISHSRIIKMIPDGARVLDIGCHSGFLGKYLAAHKGCHVEGMEIDPESAAIASRAIQNVFIGDLDEEIIWNEVGNKKYDIIVAGDVIEHLKSPEKILTRLKKYITADGKVIISIPNMAHFRVRLDLLLGRFEYKNTGIMDSSHLRFFTYRTILSLISNCGYRVIQEEHSLGRRTGSIHFLRKTLPKRLFAEQFIFLLKPIRRT